MPPRLVARVAIASHGTPSRHPCAAGVSLDASRLPRHWNVSASTSPPAAATSLLLDAASGTPLLHWTELDHSGDGGMPDGYPRATLLWSAGRLRDATRYIVAFRKLVDANGNPMPAASDGFAA